MGFCVLYHVFSCFLQLRESAGHVSDVQRELSMLKQAVKDKERQIALLIAEIERLQGRPVSAAHACKPMRPHKLVPHCAC